MPRKSKFGTAFEQLVTGELEICTLPEISKKEKNTRLEILKLLAYFRNALPQSAIIEVYKAIILKIEKGILSWSESLTGKVEKMLDRAVSRNKNMRGVEKQSKIKEEAAAKEMNKDKVRKEFGLLTNQGERIIYCLE